MSTTNLTPTSQDYSFDKNPVISDIDPRDITQPIKLVGTAVGEEKGYPIGLLVKIDFSAKTFTPYASADGVGDTIILGFLQDNVTGIATGVTSTQEFNVVWRNVDIHVPSIKTHTELTNLEEVLNKLEQSQNMAIIRG